jgi:hypothetical protein
VAKTPENSAVRSIHALFEAKMAQKAHGYCVVEYRFSFFQPSPEQQYKEILKAVL